MNAPGTPPRRRSAVWDLLAIALVTLALVGVGMMGPFDTAFAWLHTRLQRGIDELLFAAILTGLGLALFAFLRARDARRQFHAREAAEERFRTLVEQMPVVTYTWDPSRPTGSVPALYVSPQIESILGFTPQEWQRDPELWIRQIHPDDRERVVAASAWADRTGEPLQIEYRHLKKDGTEIWVREEAVVVERDGRGRPSLVQGVMTDITERKRIEESLAEAEARYRTLVERVPAVTYIWDAEVPSGAAPASYLSPQVAHLLGYDRSALQEDPGLWNRLMHDEDRDRVFREWDTASSAGEAFRSEYRMRTREDRTIWVQDEAVPVGRAPNGHRLYQGVVFDVTERKEAEEELARAEERYRTLVEQLPIVVYQDALDDVSTALYLSPQYERLFGYPVQERIADPAFWIGHLHPEDRDRVMEESRRSNRTGEPFISEYRFLAADGRYLWIRDEAVLLRDADGSPMLWQGILMDVTERREADTALARRDAVLEAISFSASRFLQSASWVDAIALVLERLGVAVGASRAYLFENGRAADGMLTMNARFEWSAPDVVSVIDDPRNHDYPYADGYGHWEAALSAGRAVTALRTASEGPERHDMDEEGIRSLAAVPVMVGEEWWGFMGFDDCAVEREWSASELDLLRAAADTLGAAIGRQRAEANLAEAELRYRTLVETMPAVTYVQGPEPGDPVSYVSPQIEAMLGYPAGEYTPSFDGWAEMIHPDDRDAVLAEDRRTDQTGEPFVAEYRMRAADGRWIWVRDEAILVHDAQGRRRYWQGVRVDITERKQAEAHVLEAEQRYRTLVENLPAVTYVDAVDEGSTTLYVSPQVEELFGYTPEEWKADPELWPHALHPDDHDRVVDASRRHNKAGEPFDVEYRMRTKSGEWRWVSDRATALSDDAGRILFSQGVMFDITERRRADEQLRETEARYRAIVEHVPAAIYVDHADGSMRSVYVSPQIEQLFGVSAERWLSEPELWIELMDPDDRGPIRESYLEAVREGRPWVGEYRVTRPDGRLVWVHDETTIVEGEEGRPLFLQGVLFDVTERKQAEEALRSSERREREAADRLRSLDDMKNTFLAAVSHELRSPLTSILGLSVTLEQTELDEEDRDDLLRRLSANARKLDRLLKDLLDIDRLNRGIVTPKYRPTDVGALVRRTVENFETAGDRPITVEADPIVLPVDPAKVERIVENLLANAVRHTAEGTPIWVQVHPRDGGALLAVEDEGVGVPRELQRAIFEPFRQGPTAAPHAPGTGIGLSLVAMFAELHGGRAWVEDRDGGGASFRVFLPGTPVTAPVGVRAAEPVGRADAG